MRNKRKMLAILLVIGFVLAACGDSGGNDTTTTAGGDQGATTTTAVAAETTTTGAESMEIATDVGVDLEAMTINVGLLSDLSGPFAPLVQAIVAGHEAYWASVNANGGINGLMVDVSDYTRDTAYVVDQHVQLYEELKTQVVAFGHSTGSPHTVAINPQLQADGILAIPLTWYSGWSDPAINSNLLPHGTPYCIEAMNVIDFMKSENPDATTIALAGNPGDYGEDSLDGARMAAEALGLEVVLDDGGKINGADEASLTEVANDIAGSGADLVWITTSPGPFGSIYGQALAAGFDAKWSGAAPSWSPALIAPDSAIKDALADDFYISQYYTPWGYDSPGNAEVRDTMAEFAPDAGPLDYYAEGFIEAKILHAALSAAYDAGDMTQAGVLAAAKSLESVTFDGLAPDEHYFGDPNDIVQRAQFISRPDPAGLAGGTNTGSTLVAENYTSPTAAAFEFNEACYKLEG
jgi:ABC-type branched-subunit amino acid transport system substrate-binding protein